MHQFRNVNQVHEVLFSPEIEIRHVMHTAATSRDPIEHCATSLDVRHVSFFD